MANCKNCNAQADQNYCPNCGQTLNFQRIDWHYISHEIIHLLHFESGFLFTIKELLVRPGNSIGQFLTKNRSKLVKPIVFIIITSLIYTIVEHYFHNEEAYGKFDETKISATSLIFKWIQANYGYANIIMGVFIAFWVKLFFRKHDYNFFEILILMCFVMGIGMLIMTVFAIFQGLTHIELLQIATYIGIVYCSWAIGQFFGRQKLLNYLKAFLSYILGMIIFFLLAIGIGNIIDLINHL